MYKKRILNKENIPTGRIAWRSPSNLALVKYWGKYGRQLPRNPSISFTLNNAFTETVLEYSPKEEDNQDIKLDFFFEKEENDAFRNKMLKFLESITDVYPFLTQLHLTVHSYNSFPHSTGIASSASAMSALAACLCSLEKELFGTLENSDDFYQKSSFIARLGSGSASRSVYPHLAIWGESDVANGSSIAFDNGAVTTIDVWEDPQCPVCKSFEDANKEYLDGLIREKKATVRFHVLSFLGDESVRAANASFCAADENKYIDFHKALYRVQSPLENSGFWSNETLIAIGDKVGITSEKFCCALRVTAPSIQKAVYDLGRALSLVKRLR